MFILEDIKKINKLFLKSPGMNVLAENYLYALKQRLIFIIITCFFYF